MGVSGFRRSVYRPLKPKRTIPRDVAKHAGPHNRWGGPLSSRSGLRGQNVSGGAVPTAIVQGYFVWYCGFPFPPNPALTNHAHSRHPHRGIFTQFLFYYRNLLYRHLFPGEILMNSKRWIRQSGGLTPHPLY